MLNLIEHISDPRGTLLQIEKMMNKGGIVLIKTPNTESLDARFFKNSYCGGLHCPRHWMLFSQKSFRLTVDNTGLEVSKNKIYAGCSFLGLECTHQNAESRLGKDYKGKTGNVSSAHTAAAYFLCRFRFFTWRFWRKNFTDVYRVEEKR